MLGKDNNDEQSQSFVSSSSLKNYAVATGSLTLVINLSLYIYQMIANRDMPTWLLIIIALSLSLFYINSFFKREKGLTNAQHVWITFMNAIMLFTSISGVNGMLDSTHRQLDTKDSLSSQSLISPNHSRVTEASIGDFLKHLIFPTHAWFNSAEAEQTGTKEIITSVINSIDITQKLADTLIMEKTRDMAIIDSLHRTVDTLGVYYNIAVESFNESEKILKARGISHKISMKVLRIVPQTDTARQELQLHHQEQIQQLQLQQQELQQHRQQLRRRQ